MPKRLRYLENLIIGTHWSLRPRRISKLDAVTTKLTRQIYNNSCTVLRVVRRDNVPCQVRDTA